MSSCIEPAASRAEGTLKIYLIAPRNPESFWTFDRVLPSLNKQCIFPNLSMPTVAGLTPREHEIVLCDENVEPVDFDTDADIVGVTGYIDPQEADVRDHRRVPASRQIRGGGRAVRLAVPGGAARARSTCSSSTRPSRPGRSSCATTQAGTWQARVPPGREAQHARFADAALRSAEGRPLPRHDHPVRARLPVQLRVLRHHRRCTVGARARSRCPR